MLTATLAALFAAALFAVSAALQHRSAGLVTEADSLRTARLGGFISGTLRHPMWIVGSAAGIAGFALHALALRDGPLTLVQPLLVSSAVFALALRQLLERRRPRRSELRWAFGLVVGLVLFLTIATPADGVTKPADALPTLVIGTLIGFGLLGFFVAGRRATGSAAAALLGTATGLSFAAKAGLLKQVMGPSTGPGCRYYGMAPLCFHRRLALQSLAQSARLPSRAASLEPAGDHDGRPGRQLGDRGGHLRRAVPQQPRRLGRRGLRAGSCCGCRHRADQVRGLAQRTKPSSRRRSTEPTAMHCFLAIREALWRP